MSNYNRRQSPSVKNGQIQKKNNWEISPDYYSYEMRELVIDRKRPGQGFRHVLMQRDIERFIQILPDWEEMSRDLDAIVLAPGDDYRWGYHTTGVVHLCAWPENWEQFYDWQSFKRERYLFTKIGVQWRSTDEGADVLFTLNTARAFMLLDVLLHELGHHYDRITTRSMNRAARGEPYANDYARKYGDLVWERFTKHFPLD